MGLSNLQFDRKQVTLVGRVEIKNVMKRNKTSHVYTCVTFIRFN